MKCVNCGAGCDSLDVKVLQTSPEGLSDALPAHRGATSARGPPAPWWAWASCGALAAALRRGAKGMPLGRLRTLGVRVTAFLTAWSVAIVQNREY